MIGSSEHLEQQSLIQWCETHKQQYPELPLIFAIPNGGLRNIVVAMKLKAEGQKKGVPDLFLPCARKGFYGLFIEMKYGKNKTTPEQDWWGEHLADQGYAVAICYGMEEAVQVIEKYLEEENE